jgi:tetratricopeptide (TPR) repeat protein
MSWFTKHKKDHQVSVPAARGPSEAERMLYHVPTTDEEIEQKIRDMEEANRMVAGNAALQEAIARMTGEEPSPPPPPSLEDLRARAAAGGLSYLVEPPADLQEACPEAAQLFMQGAMMSALTGDEESSLAQFEEALGLVRAIGHQRAEVRLLYNIGVAHHKLGNDQRAIEVLAEGKALAEEISADLAREARKLQRFEEERKIDDPRVKVFGTPDIEQKILAMFLEALAKVYDAMGLPTQASTCRAEVERLYRDAGQ